MQNYVRKMQQMMMKHCQQLELLMKATPQGQLPNPPGV